MASTLTDQQHLNATLSTDVHDHDPGGTTAIIVSPDGGTTKRTIDMRDYSHFQVVAMPTVVGGGGLTKLEIIASAASDMSSPVVIKDSGTVAADAALTDKVVSECSTEDLNNAGASLRYVAGRLTMATATDEAVVVYVAQAKRPRKDLTATSIS